MEYKKWSGYPANPPGDDVLFGLTTLSFLVDGDEIPINIPA